MIAESNEPLAFDTVETLRFLAAPTRSDVLISVNIREADSALEFGRVVVSFDSLSGRRSILGDINVDCWRHGERELLLIAKFVNECLVLRGGGVNRAKPVNSK